MRPRSRSAVLLLFILIVGVALGITLFFTTCGAMIGKAVHP
jgi:hypothetical protein